MQYTVIYSARATLCMEIKGDSVIIRAPKRCTKRQIEQFAAKHEKWAQKKLEQNAKRPVAPISASATAEQIEQLKKTARQVILPRAQYLSNKSGLCAKKFGITAARSRFGSCSGKDSINFSCFLVLYPPELIDYVIMHELCHTVHKNHSSRFYNLLKSHLPNYKELQYRLKHGDLGIKE